MKDQGLSYSVQVLEMGKSKIKAPADLISYEGPISSYRIALSVSSMVKGTEQFSGVP
jgi:hypothetical protein